MECWRARIFCWLSKDLIFRNQQRVTLNLASRQLVGEFMIDVAVMALIFADYNDNITQPRIGPQFPVINGNLRCGDIRGDSLVYFSQILGVAVNCFLLEVTYNP